jgi:hypothetical protein
MKAKDLNHTGKYKDFLTVGKLKELLEKFNVSDDYLICVQRVEDYCYDTGGWKTIKRNDPIYPGYQQEYTPVFSPCFYDEDKDDKVLMLDLHY